ncbi:uncharacterized protein PHACADRAFT_266233 [Phanerochaete carnosa HHB-10118-sp]|uniref:Uncharacterized protein n=1 Tax=Phanerochaete carnosa (strain HHB-10118-sp) TaxID=650164 RepID=K5VC19_PHACS|nr:uncharacterized protein PHACADRAFT_266233 [Phanerochaete carnosa HHB-10118-sp]EKM48643.1 hypothetical protein PHACADRAFT_266233 [Phanerochaete carnosa HHB-10118-sp]
MPGDDYDLLPSSEKGARKQIPFSLRASRFLKLRRATAILVATVASVILVGFYLVRFRGTDMSQEIPEPEPVPEPLPPLYPEYHRAELALPQHDPRRPFEGGRKYMWVADHTYQSGFGNFMQDMIMNAQLVYETGRSYVFDNFTWDRDGPEYAQFGGKTIPSRIPLSALISGPIVGGPFGDNDPTPRAVVKEYWDQICPNKTIIRADEIRKLHGEGADARKILDTWVDYIKDIDDPCLEVERYSGSIFHVFMFGTPNEIMPVWPTFSQSPILQLFGWGQLAHTAFETNRHLFSPAPLIAPYVTSPTCPNCVDPYARLDGLLALHIRRGDFMEHCPNLGNWGAGFSAFNSFPSFPDLWVPPEGEHEQRMAVYLRRCLPTIEQIVEKVEQVRAGSASEGLRHVYIMSNGDREWLADLKAALLNAHDWELVATSRDLVLTPEQRYTSHTLDMLIGERAQVLIGNGFSSMTSNIAMLRMARQQPSDTTRMW